MPAWATPIPPHDCIAAVRIPLKLCLVHSFLAFDKSMMAVASSSARSLGSVLCPPLSGGKRVSSPVSRRLMHSLQFSHDTSPCSHMPSCVLPFVRVSVSESRACGPLARGCFMPCAAYHLESSRG